jgi:Fe-S oxidoreductase
MLQALLDGEIELTPRVVELAYLCTTCNWCTERCPSNSFIREVLIDIPAILEAFRKELVERGLVLPKVKEYLRNISKYGNPWGLPREKREEWVKGTKIQHYRPGDEFLYYVGDVGSYDPRAVRIAIALGEVLSKSGISFGILGKEENSDGNDVKMLGEIGLFHLLMDNNIRQFKKLGVKKIVTLSPHSYNVFKKCYVQCGEKLEVIHYTTLLQDLIKRGKLSFYKDLRARVTYHDPCFLGRYNKEYDAPRDVLRKIPGIEIIEMRRNKSNSLCCGGGSAMFYTGLLDGSENAPGRIRVREAYDCGADILAVACPICAIMFEDAIKEEGLEEKLKVMDISEIVNEVTSNKVINNL